MFGWLTGFVGWLTRVGNHRMVKHMGLGWVQDGCGPGLVYAEIEVLAGQGATASEVNVQIGLMRHARYTERDGHTRARRLAPTDYGRPQEQQVNYTGWVNKLLAHTDTSRR